LSANHVDSSTDRQAAARDLQVQLIGFKRTLHLIRTGSGLHRRTTAAGVPVLGVLRRCGPLRTTAIAAEFGLDPSTVSRQVDALVQSGHVEKVPDPADGRAALVQLTEQGQAELAAHVEDITAALGGVLDRWSMDDLRTLTALLGRLNDDVYDCFAPQTSQENP
jgi:DNA-binding MarR family transcriptional regulator